ncbi:hypothetical protein MNBD_NITROSPINAE04-2154 [hydrothermal vent metagenome]|uniref:Calcineurin-like phosphoesterase domain-containing protein n=1 Tax=hydrothermal vent metagenome TaxID=652676 RepID=A0A3B1CDN3_9ZZZZ
MRYAFMSDVHSNIEAFEAVLEDIDNYNPDKILFLGDIVGYGPNPNECVARLLEVSNFTLGGNHDWAVVGKTSSEYFNPFAREALNWTIETLTEKHADFLKTTEASAIVDGFQVAHSTPKHPEEWRYIMSQKEALGNYLYLEADICFIGHSHQPVIIEYESAEDLGIYRDSFMELDTEKKYLINVGSVGQSRDGNEDSCWVMYDSVACNVEFHRVRYDVRATQKKMAMAKLPQYLIDRLSFGR